MKLMRTRARTLAAITVAWHVVAIAVVSAALSCNADALSEHAGTPDCPLHDNAPACPIHAEKHGTHECDCPTIGCSQTDTGLIALFGAVGILSPAPDMRVQLQSSSAILGGAESVNPLAPAPLAPPPRA
jgi:hypothetical protein